MAADTIKIEGPSIRYWTNVGGLGGDDKKRRTVVLFHGNAFSLDSWKKTKTLEISRPIGPGGASPW